MFSENFSLQQKGDFQSEVNNLSSQLQQMLQERYLSKVNELISEERQKVIQNPPKEIQLLQAIKPFFSDKNQPALEKVIETLFLLSLLKQLQNKSNCRCQCTCNSLPSDESSVHSDGIYEYDMACLNEKKNRKKSDIKIISGLFNQLINSEYVNKSL